MHEVSLDSCVGIFIYRMKFVRYGGSAPAKKILWPTDPIFLFWAAAYAVYHSYVNHESGK
jgi:hypothetical protein